MLSAELESFPQDVISANGQPIYELIAFLTKRTPPQMSKIDPTSKKLARIEVLHKQYESLITFLKENGAMLNTIRPEYLLSHQDLLAYFKRNYNQYASPNANKISEKHHRYLSMDAWSTLFYQILKIYYLCRVSLKTFKGMKELPSDRPLMPEGYGEVSPVYSAQEIILIRWMELALDKVFPGIAKGRIVNFDTDLKNGLALGALLQLYIGNTWKKLYSLKTSINSEEDMKNNIDKIKNILREYGITPMPELFDQPKSSARDMLVYLVHLFQLLPNFLPKPTLDFQVMLRGTCVRTVQLTNPSNKMIVYGVKLDSPTPDFTVEKEFVEILPKGTASFNIKYTARISKQTKARVTFKNKKETGAQAIPIVFDLVSDVQGRYNEEIVKVENEVMLYESGTFEIPVHNPYNQSVTFTIKMENVQLPVEEKDKRRKQIGRKNKEDERIFLPAFFCKAETISISKNGTAKLPIYYLPVTLEDHRCHLIFTDEKVGEMQYEIQGKPIPPTPVDPKPSKFVCQLDNLETQYLDIARRNHRLEAALARLKDRIKDSKILINKAEMLRNVDDLKENPTFYIECNQPFLQMPPVFSLQPSKRGPDNERSRVEQGDTQFSSSTEASNKLPINLLYKYPVQNQPATVMLFNPSRTDVRMYNLEVTVMPKKVKAQLEMKTPARIPLTQNIPVINTLDSEVSVKMTMERVKNGEAFKLPFPTDQHVFKVGREPYQFKLTFEPEWMNESLAKLVLFNRDTNEHFEYELRGIGEEPLAEKEFIVECKLKEEKILVIDIEAMRKTRQSTKSTSTCPTPLATRPWKYRPGRTASTSSKLCRCWAASSQGRSPLKTSRGFTIGTW